MRTVVDYVYSFKFKSALSALDGIYKVISILSYDELVRLNIDLAATTYSPNSLDDVAFEADMDQIRVGQIVKLESVNDANNVQYIPEHLFSEIPDGSIQKYLRLGLAVDLGTFDDADRVSTIKSEMEQTVAAMVGVNSKALIYTISDTWMSASDYQTIDNIRNVTITQVSNHFTDKMALQRQVDSLKTLIKYYEDTLKAL